MNFLKKFEDLKKVDAFFCGFQKVHGLEKWFTDFKKVVRCEKVSKFGKSWRI